MAYLLDTNVLSELRKGTKADANVLKWARAHTAQRHCISALSIGEIRKGIDLLKKKAPDQSRSFENWLSRIKSDFEDDILSITDEVAEQWGGLMAQRSRPVVDSLLAATAMVHHLIMVTRNTADFEGTGVTVINPWA